MREEPVGGCLCGEVRYRITAEPVEAMYCHCRMCQRAHGAPVTAWLTLPLDAFAVTTGNPVGYRSSARAFRHFCGRCGTPLTFQLHASPEELDVTVCSMDHPARMVPEDHTQTLTQLPWIRLADGLPRHETERPPLQV